MSEVTPFWGSMYLSARIAGNILADAIYADEFFISGECLWRNKTDSL